MSTTRNRWIAGMATIFTILAGAVVPAAHASPPLPPGTQYSVVAGSSGTHGLGSDTPSGLFIDKNGTFYTQQSAAFYGANDHRYWRFSTGADIGSVQDATALNSAADPANPVDRNDNTTWRCNHGPTGQEATPPPPGSSYSQPNFCDLIGTWVDPDSGDWIGLVHNEFTPQPFGDGWHYDSIDYAVSKDQGRTWDIRDHVVTSPFSTDRGDADAFPQQTYYFGDGDQRLFVDIASGYFYMYYGSMVINKSDGAILRHQHVARAPISEKLSPGSWRKWYDGSWDEPGLGGRESNMTPVSGPSDAGYTSTDKEYNPATPGTWQQQLSAGKVPDESPLMYMSVAYNAHLGLYIAQAKPQDKSDSKFLSMPYYVSDNLATQKWHKVGDTGSFKYSYFWYHWFVDSVNLTDSNIVGRTFREYCNHNCPSGSSEWREFAINSTSPAAYVIPEQGYQIAFGPGTVLSQDGKSTRALAPSESLASVWAFRPLGDGSYAVLNQRSGEALTIPTEPGKRAWGTAPTMEADKSTTKVGQQWWIIPTRSEDSSVVLGSFRLVNRYSGLVLSLPASGTIETAPPRSWTDVSGTSVGGSRTMAEQIVSFSAVTTPLNVALRKPATASSTEGTFGPSMATDGQDGVLSNGTPTYWAGGPTPSWWQVDLQGLYDLDRINVQNYADGARAYQYTIQASANGKEWTTIATKAGNDVATNSGDEYAVDAVAQYVRITITANTANSSAHIANVIVNGTRLPELATNKVVTASGAEAVSPASHAVDGEAIFAPGSRTYWGAAGPGWLKVDLGSVQNLRRISVTNYSDGSRFYKYDIQVSTDGAAWTTVAQKASNSPATATGDHYLVSGTARYVRVNMLSNSANGSVHIVNLGVN